MDISIKRSEDAAGFTAGEDYDAVAVTSGGVIILDDDRHFQVIGFDRINGDEWELTTSEDKKGKTTRVWPDDKEDD